MHSGFSPRVRAQSPTLKRGRGSLKWCIEVLLLSLGEDIREEVRKEEMLPPSSGLLDDVDESNSFEKDPSRELGVFPPKSLSNGAKINIIDRL